MKSCSKVAASPYTTWFKLKTVNGKSVCGKGFEIVKACLHNRRKPAQA